jgi:ribonuclease T2
MRLPRHLALVGVLVLLAVSLAIARGHGHRGEKTSAAHFDYWLMSLSWSPSYCVSHPQDQHQCGRKGYGFVLHGLWPQWRRGYGPQYCGADASPDDGTVQRALSFMPSRRLITHEWEAHGSCSGMAPEAYFAEADRAFASVKIPAALASPRAPQALDARGIARAFADANPGLGTNMLSVVCRDGGTLSEVRVCLNRDTLAPQACTGRVRNTCRSGNLRIPAAR